MHADLDTLARGARQALGGRDGGPALAALAEAAGPVAWRIALRVLGNPTAAADVMQEALLKLATNLRTYDAERPFLPWFGRIVSRAAMDQQRFERARPRTDLREVVEMASPARERPDAVHERRWLHETLNDLAGELSGRQRAVFVLRDLEGFGIEEIAAQLELAPSTVRVHLARARAHIRDRWRSRHETRTP